MKLSKTHLCKSTFKITSNKDTKCSGSSRDSTPEIYIIMASETASAAASTDLEVVSSSALRLTVRLKVAAILYDECVELLHWMVKNQTVGSCLLWRHGLRIQSTATVCCVPNFCPAVVFSPRYKLAQLTVCSQL